MKFEQNWSSTSCYLEWTKKLQMDRQTETEGLTDKLTPVYPVQIWCCGDIFNKGQTNNEKQTNKHRKVLQFSRRKIVKFGRMKYFKV